MIIAANENEAVAHQRNACKAGTMRTNYIDAELRFSPQHRFCHAEGGVVVNRDPVLGIRRGILPEDMRQRARQWTERRR